VYKGPELTFLVKELIPGQPYTFRVCCRAEGDQEWSAWSLAKVAVTRHKPFGKPLLIIITLRNATICFFSGWQVDNPSYQVTNDNKIASKITSDPSILYSSSAQFGPGHSIEFTVKICIPLNSNPLENPFSY